MRQGLSIKQQFKMPAAYAVGDVPAQGKNAQQMAQRNVESAGINARSHRVASGGSSSKPSPVGAVGFAGLAAYIPRRAPRSVATPGYNRASYAPSPSFYGMKSKAA